MLLISEILLKSFILSLPVTIFNFVFVLAFIIIILTYPDINLIGFDFQYRDTHLL